jgi:hypothetical protein
VEGIGRLIGVVGVLLFAAGVVLQVITFRRKRPIRPVAIVVGQGASLLGMVAFSLVTQRPPDAVAWVVLLGVGVAAGIWYARLVKVERTPNGTVMSFTLPWLLVWAALMGLTQLFALLRGTVPVLVYGLAIANMGLNLGMNAAVIRRSRGPASPAIAAVLIAGALLSALAVLPASQLAYAREVVAAWGERYFESAAEIPAAIRSAYAPPGPAVISNDVVSTGQADVSVKTVARIGFSPVHSKTPSTANLQYQYAGSTAGGLAARRFVSIQWSTNPQELRANAAPSGLGSQGVREVNSVGGIPVDLGYYSVQTANDGSVHEWRLLKGSVFVMVIGDTTGARGTGGKAQIPEAEAAAILKAAMSVTPAAALGTSLEAQKPGQPDTAVPPKAGTSKGKTGSATSSSKSRTVGPLTPGRAGGALLLSSLLMSGGSLVQLLISLRSGGKAPVLSAEDAFTRDMKSRGMVWSDTWGWVTPEELREREASREAGRTHNRAQDAEAARYSKGAAEAKAALIAIQANRERLAKVGKLWERQAALQLAAQADAAEAAYWERLGRTTDAIQTAADVGVNVIASATGPAGQIIRAGYDVAKGVAGGLGTAIATDGDIGSAMARGYVSGLVSAAVDTGVDLLGQRLLSGTPAAPKPVPADLLRTKAVVSQTLAGVDQLVAEKGVAAAAKSVDPARVLALYKNGGMKELGRLEAAGAISASEAKVLNQVLGHEVEGSIHAGVNDAISEFQRSGLGVRVREVLVGDSGSSAIAGKARSVFTDFDRTAVAQFERADVIAYAERNGMEPAKAYDELNRVFTRMQERAVDARLTSRGVSAADVDYKTYSGFGSTAGHADSYPSGFALTRQSVQGRTTVFRADGTTYRSGGDTILDQWRLNKAAMGEGSALGVEAKITSAEIPGIAEKQLESLVAHSDAKSAAKAIDRLQYCASRLGGSVDSRVASVAQAIKADPQGAAGVLARHGMTEAEFVTAAREDAARIAGRMLGQ